MSPGSGILRNTALSIRSGVASSFTQPVRSSFRPHRQEQHHSRPYSSPPPNVSQYDRSQYKILPLITIIGIGTGSYIFLVKSRTGVHKPKPASESP
ncbi:hypothetical protein BDV28DRAFT_137203 [Aspergillus coremiiformis]|uniref:Uncharacterized protein n=1 Tax=Aspergillus coremiiformis TaxID=138285 RepID=A0A5N6Z178_9EURO|nr:hypothetical protein BDV28DRAFT_137203 [Aspergillus coremiiformis]